MLALSIVHSVHKTGGEGTTIVEMGAEFGVKIA